MKQETASIVDRIERSGCTLCPDLVNARTKIVVSRGNPNADVVIVGQNPGAKEDESGKPFSGPAGQLLDRIVADAGFSVNNDFWYTNVVMCHTLGNARPSTEHINNCSRNFSQITASQKKIVAVGSAAVEGILRSYGPEYIAKTSLSMSKLLTHGQPIRLSGNKWLFITYHPSYLLRNQAANPAFPDYQTILNELKAAKAWDKEFEVLAEDTANMYNQTSFF